MNAVRSPEDIMPAIPPAAPPPRVNPLQRIWLREIGMEKLWLKPAPAARQVDAQVVDLKRKRPSVRLGSSVRTRPRRSRCPLQRRRRAARRAGSAGARRPGRAQRPPPSRSPSRSRKSPRPRSFRRRARAQRHPGRTARAGRVLTACGLCQDAATRSSAMAASRALAGGGRGAGRTGRPPGPALRRPFGPAARRHAVGRGHEPRARRVHRQRDQVPPARQPQSQARGNRRLQPLPDAPDRAAQARAHPGAGRFAAQTLLGTEATIGSLRGRVHQLKTDAGPQIPVIVSYHRLPAQPGGKVRAWQDLKLAASLN